MAVLNAPVKNTALTIKRIILPGSTHASHAHEAPLP
jgi:hypothetical protein